MEGRDFAGRAQANANWLRSRPAQGRTFTSLLATLREVISPRLSLLQLVNHSGGRTSFSFGGNFVSNRVTIGIEYQTIYVPFAIGNQFKQALVLNLRLQPFGNFQVNAGTFVAPDGTVKYTTCAGTFLYRGNLGGTAPAAITLHKYVVLGSVTEADGKPIRGAALRIDGDLAITDSQGRFFSRKRKAGSHRLK